MTRLHHVNVAPIVSCPACGRKMAKPFSKFPPHHADKNAKAKEPLCFASAKTFEQIKPAEYRGFDIRIQPDGWSASTGAGLITCGPFKTITELQVLIDRELS